MAVTAVTKVTAKRQHGDSQYQLERILLEQLNKNRRGVMDVDLPSINAGAAANVDVALPASEGVVAGVLVDVYPPASLAYGLIVQGATVLSTNNIRIRVLNITGGAIDEASAVWGYRITGAVPIDVL